MFWRWIENSGVKKLTSDSFRVAKDTSVMDIDWEDTEWEVDKVVKSKVEQGVNFYLVKWKVINPFFVNKKSLWSVRDL